MTTRLSHRLIAILALSFLGLFMWATSQAVGQDKSMTGTTAGWEKSPRSPVGSEHHDDALM